MTRRNPYAFININLQVQHDERPTGHICSFTRVSQKVSHCIYQSNKKAMHNSKVQYFSTQSLWFSIYMAQHCTGSCKPSEKNIFNQLASHICTASFNSWSLIKSWLLKAFLRGSNRLKSDGTRSGLYGGCSKISKCSCWSVSAVWTTHLQVVVLSIYPEPPTSAHNAIPHHNIYCSSSHPFPDNAQGLVLTISEQWEYSFSHYWLKF
jgi:hypothetical protein